ncbi:MAG: LPS-assembly protein LptD [bacterium]|nr:LPS-assembly protein LptD [bacterium]
MYLKINHISLIVLAVVLACSFFVQDIIASMNRLNVSSLDDTDIAQNQSGALQRGGGEDNFQSIMPQTQKIAGLDARADSFDFVGDNMIATGNVFVRRGDMLIYADKAIINNTNKNIELSGNVKFFKLTKNRQEIEYYELVDLEKNPYIKFKVVGTTMTPAGRQMLVVDVIEENLSWTGERAIGNINSGVFEFGNYDANLSGWYTAGGAAKRDKNGKLVVKNAVMSPCPGLMEGNAVMSIKSGKMVAIPGSNRVSTSLNSKTGTDKRSAADVNDYHLWAYNNIIYVAGVPVMWLPVLYKPPPGKMGQWRFGTGSSTPYGYYFQLSSFWNLWDSDGVEIDTLPLLDYYEKRGLALGDRTRIRTDNSETDIFAYGINDKYSNYDFPDNSRFNSSWRSNSGDSVEAMRYYVDVKNKTHITDRMDFRGRFAAVSDYYFLNDYFDDVFRVDPQPSTYGNLNYQFDWGTLSLNVHPKVNPEFTAVQELPKLELVVPRQEIWNNIYYQTETNVSYMQMNWTKFKQSRASYAKQYPDTTPGNPGFGNLVEPSNYSAARFDTLHFVYYPLKLGWLNILPRAGGRFTAYSNSSKNKVDDLDVNTMILVSKPEMGYGSYGAVNNYDSKGGFKARLIPEVGLQLNTKMYKSWSNVKNAYWEMDGMRHVFQPYLNYALIAPTTSRDHIYYFDDTDRYDNMHYVRVGLENRLQTRRGGWKSSQVYTWASMHNYIDFLIDDKNRNNTAIEGTQGGSDQSGNYLGDFGHILTINPTQDVQLTLNLLMDGGKMITGNFAEAFAESNFQFNYDFADGWGFFGNWYYSTNNFTTPAVSMGSDLTQIESGTYFQRMFWDSSYTQMGLNWKINDRTFGQTYVEYDFQNNLMPDFNFNLNRELPCNLMLVLSYSVSKRLQTSGSGVYTSQDFNASINFTTTPTYSIAPKDSMMPEYLSGAPEGAPMIGSPLAPNNTGI